MQKKNTTMNTKLYLFVLSLICIITEINGIYQPCLKKNDQKVCVLECLSWNDKAECVIKREYNGCNYKTCLKGDFCHNTSFACKFENNSVIVNKNFNLLDWEEEEDEEEYTLNEEKHEIKMKEYKYLINYRMDSVYDLPVSEKISDIESVTQRMDRSCIDPGICDMFTDIGLGELELNELYDEKRDRNRYIKCKNPSHYSTFGRSEHIFKYRWTCSFLVWNETEKLFHPSSFIFIMNSICLYDYIDTCRFVFPWGLFDNIKLLWKHIFLDTLNK